MRALLPLVLAGTLIGAGAPGAGAPDDPAIDVRDVSGTYRVSAAFTVPEPAGIVRSVLTDYEQIPRFVPGVRSSRVLERRGDQVRIEQEAVATYLLFSKRVLLELDIVEAAHAIRFRDRRRTSFARYEGSWAILEGPDWTFVAYELTAEPAFEVPGFVLRRLLRRDARGMIDGLRQEMASRVGATGL